MHYFSCQHREQYISKRKHEITIVILQIYISGLELYKDGPLNSLFIFVKYIFGIWSKVRLVPIISCSPNLVRVMNF